MFYLCQW
jgi:hypothetical protein